MQLQRAPLHAFPSVVQLQLTISRSSLGATGAVEIVGVRVEPSTLQPKLAVSLASTSGLSWSAAFHRSIWRWADCTCSCRFSSVGGSFLSGGGFLRLQAGRSRHGPHSLFYNSSAGWTATVLGDLVQGFSPWVGWGLQTIFHIARPVGWHCS